MNHRILQLPEDSMYFEVKKCTNIKLESNTTLSEMTEALDAIIPSVQHLDEDKVNFIIALTESEEIVPWIRNLVITPHEIEICRSISEHRNVVPLLADLMAIKFILDQLTQPSDQRTIVQRLNDSNVSIRRTSAEQLRNIKLHYQDIIDAIQEIGGQASAQMTQKLRLLLDHGTFHLKTKGGSGITTFVSECTLELSIATTKEIYSYDYLKKIAQKLVCLQHYLRH
jgi:hypothetical protein